MVASTSASSTTPAAPAAARTQLPQINSTTME
jgi:hypothetical protein